MSLRTEDTVRNVREAAGWITLDRLSVIRVGGPQRVKFLHSLLSNDISGLGVGHSRLAALMNLKGQQVAWMRVMAETDALICELPGDVRDTVMTTFAHYKVGTPVRFEKLDTVVLGLFGVKALEVVRGLGFSDPPSEKDSFTTVAGSFGALRASRGPDLPAEGFTLHVEPIAASAVEQHLRQALGEPMPSATLETLRVEEGIPWHGIDVKEENLLHETGQLNVYHSPSKGCYLGQEVVARLEGRGGNVNKRFRGLACAQPVVSGSRILVEEAEGKDIGYVTSVGESPRFGAIAMGYLHRSHAEAGTKVSLAGRTAEVIDLPFRV
ncbi:MAG: hypothetical protein JJE39_06960 [Vicinamibacteria bacterium]|nr:hypothetical protein [Vicinamibacteria bacterium]